MNELLELRLERPAWLLLGLLLPWLLRRGRGEAALPFAPAFLWGADGAPARSWRVRLLGLPTVLLGGALALGALALAGPVRRQPLPLVAQGIDVLLVLDLSSSMDARDLDPARDRLSLAQDAAARFVEGRPQDRIGLVGFARHPDVLCPPTLSHRALTDVLRATALVEPDGPEDRTGIGTAVARAAQVLARSDAPSKVIVLLTDGEENVAGPETPDEIDPLEAAALCARLGVRVHAIAQGTGRRQPDGTFAPLDTTALRELGRRTGGSFHEARDARAVEGVFEEVARLERVRFEEPRFVDRPRFAAVLLLALLLGVAGLLLEVTVLEVLP